MTFFKDFSCTLFSKRSAHWFHPVLPVTLGHWPRPRFMSSLSIVSNYSQDHFTELKWGGRWPRDFRKCAKHSESVLGFIIVFLSKAIVSQYICIKILVSLLSLIIRYNNHAEMWLTIVMAINLTPTTKTLPQFPGNNIWAMEYLLQVRCTLTAFTPFLLYYSWCFWYFAVIQYFAVLSGSLR